MFLWWIRLPYANRIHIKWHDKTNQLARAPSEDSDQPGHLPSLTWVFTVRIKKAWVLSWPLNAQQNSEQTGLMPRLTWVFVSRTCCFIDETSLCAQWVAKDPSFLHASSEDIDQTGRMPRLIWLFAGRTSYFVGFVVRWLICNFELHQNWGQGFYRVNLVKSLSSYFCWLLESGSLDPFLRISVTATEPLCLILYIPHLILFLCLGSPGFMIIHKLWGYCERLRPSRCLQH